jgi:hypothetical protein
MLSSQDNEVLCRAGAGEPMGELFRCVCRGWKSGGDDAYPGACPMQRNRAAHRAYPEYRFIPINLIPIYPELL